jgi:hypothetical protein
VQVRAALPGTHALVLDLVTRLTSAPFISIAAIRGRTRSGGDEITLAFDPPG